MCASRRHVQDVWVSATVCAVDPVTGKHLLEFDDGEEEECFLSLEVFEWVRPRMTHVPPAAPLSLEVVPPRRDERCALR